MLKEIYKYTAFGARFCSNRKLPLTPANKLNDPFELYPSTEFINQFDNQMLHGVDISRHYTNVMSHSGRTVFQSRLMAYGLVSFTETPDNLLMWSHYANQHQGLVIGFDPNHPWFHQGDDVEQHVGVLSRVLYRKRRLDGLTSLSSSINEVFFHKSDEWIYEKEHRMVFFLADHQNGDVTKKEPKNMVVMPSDSIKSITFGCRMTVGDVDKIVKLLSKDLSLSHVQLFYSCLSNAGYEIERKTFGKADFSKKINRHRKVYRNHYIDRFMTLLDLRIPDEHSFFG